MWIFGGKIGIRTACFLAAFSAAGAGFLLREELIKKAYAERESAYEQLTVSDSAENLERLSFSLSELEKLPSEKRSACLSDIRLSAELALSALGHMNFESAGAEDLFSYLSGVSVIAQTALELGISDEAPSAREGDFTAESAPSALLFSVLKGYAENIVSAALPHLPHNRAEFENKLTDIFSDTSLETTLFENGFGDLAPLSGFGTIGGGMINASEAIGIARKHLGKKAYLTSEFSEGEIPVYHLGGKNISAVVSAKSGILMQFLFDLPESEEKIARDTAKEKADEFLSEIGFNSSNMALFSEEHSEGVYIFQYAPLQNKVLCLDERILVGVSHGSGRICLYDAINYYRYHSKKLTVPAEMISIENIMAKYGLSESPTLCKIERSQGIESLCYRIKIGEEEIYLSALSGIRIEPS
ncbi:MAG: germination protein YpeB [Clostridia bacterium]|nr:germination protein YpeB [Clostridia bacterium]